MGTVSITVKGGIAYDRREYRNASPTIEGCKTP